MFDTQPARAPARVSPSTLWRWFALFFAAAGVVDALFNWALGSALDSSRGLWFMVTATVPSWLILAALVPAVLRYAHRFPVHDRRLGVAVLIHLPAALALSVVHLVLAVIVSDVLLSSRAADVGLARALSRAYGNYLVFDLLVYAGIVGLYYAVDYQGRYRRQTEAAARLQVELARAQVAQLRAQLDPHFLFNALNTISGTALRREPERTAALISDLSQLLRRSLRQVSAETTLEEELDFLDAYLSIERARMGRRLHVTVDVPETLLGRRVPSLVLQPLVENAIRHGLADRSDGGRLGVVARAPNGRLRLEVWDDGPGFGKLPVDGAGRPGGLGLGNTRARLREMYGPEARLEVSNRPEGGASVVVEVPEDGRSQGAAMGRAG